MKQTLILLIFGLSFSTAAYSASAPFCDAGLYPICGSVKIGKPENPYVKVLACARQSSMTTGDDSHVIELKKILIGETVFTSLKADETGSYVLKLNDGKTLRLRPDRDSNYLYMRLWMVKGYTKNDSGEMDPDLAEMAWISYRVDMTMSKVNDSYCSASPLVSARLDCPGEISKNCSACKLAVTSFGDYITNVEEIATRFGKEQITPLYTNADGAIMTLGPSIWVSTGLCSSGKHILVEPLGKNKPGEFKAKPTDY